MNNARLYQIIKKPIYSEKTQMLEPQGVQTLQVASNATKLEIKKAVELMFDGEEVVKVNTLNVKGKTKRFGRTIGRRQDWKKAYVTLKSNQSLVDEELSQADAGEVNNTSASEDAANNE